MKPDGIEAPVAPVLGAPRRSKDRARIAAVAVVAMGVLAAGIGLAGNGFTIVPPSTGSPAPSRSAVAHASDVPTPGSAETFVPPTVSPVLDCAPVRLGKPPEIRLTSNPGSMVILGTAAPTPSAGGGSGAPAWPVLPLGGALRAGTSSLDLSAQDAGCMRYVVAEYAPAVPGATNGTVVFPIPFRTINVSPPRSDLPLGPLPAGDWTVRVVAYFSTGQAGQEDASVIERFFRVITSEVAGPIPTPVATPAVACAPLARDGGPPTLVLTGSTKGPVPGTSGLAATSLVPVRLGDRIEVQVRGDACAIGWILTATRDGDGSAVELDSEANPASDPFQFAQNRWLLHDLPTGEVTINATVKFSSDVSTSAHWRLDVNGADVPPVLMIEPGGESVTAAQAPCWASWTPVGATSGYEWCQDDPLPAAISLLVATPETLIRVDVPGWKLVSWSGSCGRADPANNPASPFVAAGCDLGGWYAADGTRAPDPAMFLTRPGVPLYRLNLQVARGDMTVGLTVYVEIEAPRR